MFTTKERIGSVRRSTDKVPFLTRFIARSILDTYMEDRAKVVGMEETDKGLDPDAFGTGTILKFAENWLVTVPASAYEKLGYIPTAEVQIFHGILPMVGVVVPSKRSERAIVGFLATPQGMHDPRFLPKPNDDSYHLRIDREELGVTRERYFDDIRVAREVPIGGFGLRHYINPGDFDKTAF